MIRVYICPLDHSINVAETEWREIRTYKREFIRTMFSVIEGKVVYQGRDYIVVRTSFCGKCAEYIGYENLQGGI